MKIDIYSPNFIIYVTIITIILIIGIFNGYYILLNIEANKYLYFIYYGIILTLYITFISLYFFELNVKMILYFTMMFTTLFTFIAFLSMFFGNYICIEYESNDKEFKSIIYWILFFIVLLFIGWEQRNTKTWYSIIRLIIILILLKIMYYIYEDYFITIIITVITILFYSKKIFSI